MSQRLVGVLSVFLLAGCIPASGQDQRVLVDRVGSTGFIQLQAESFRKLTPKDQALAYWLSQASIAIDPIIYDQLSRFGLRQKRMLEMIVAHPDGVDPAVYEKIVNFTKLFWANRGNHNDDTAQKFLPDFTYEQFKTAGLATLQHGAAGTLSPAAFLKEIDELRASLFDPNFEPAVTAKTPSGGLDILQASANNFYLNVALKDIEGFAEKYPLNSRLAKSADGKLEEQVYRVGTPDGRIKPGRYAEFLGKANYYLQQAQRVADPAQAKVIGDLIRFYQTGDPADWIQFGVAWVQNNATVDFANGFIEVYRDARGAKGTSQSFVSITDQRLTGLMAKIAGNAQYFENRAPWAPRFRKQNVQPPLAKAVETVIETGDFHVTTVGDNLPNENEIHEKYGSKSFLFTGSSRALEAAAGGKILAEFAASPEEIAICNKYGAEAGDLMTAMHEVIGHGSGKMDPKLTKDPASYLKEYYSTLEEARADLMALWNVWDPKLKAEGLISNPDVAKAMYYSAARAPLTQLRRIPNGDTIEEDHQRDRQLIVNYIAAKTGAVSWVDRRGKTYIVINDFAKMREGVGMLLAELMRIKGEGDYDAIKKLIDDYGVHFDPKIRDQVVARFQTLNLPAYWAGINPELQASLDSNDQVTGVEISYPRDYVKQQLGYSAMYNEKRR